MSSIAPYEAAPVLATLDWLLRAWLHLVFAGIIGAAAGLAFTKLTAAKYVATTDMIIMPSNLRVIGNDLYTPNLQSDSQILEVESKMRMLTSSNVLRHAVAKLDPAIQQELARAIPSTGMRALSTTEPPARNTAWDTELAAALEPRVKVMRAERSFVVSVSATMSTPDHAAAVANAIAEAFTEDVAQSDADRAGMAARNLNDRVRDLKASVAEADTKVQRFRRDHNLYQTTNGQLNSAQALEALNIKVVDAKARLVEAETRYAEISTSSTDAAGGGAVDSQALMAMRSEQATLTGQISSMLSTRGQSFPSVGQTAAALAAIKRATAAERARLVNAVRLDVVQAGSALASLQAEVQSARDTLATDSAGQIELRELERDASAKDSLYQAFLARAGEAAERQRLNATDVRIISEATPPRRQVWPPRELLALLGGAFLGFALGAVLVAIWRGAAFLRQYRARTA